MVHYRLRDDGSLCVGNQKKALAGAGKPSTQQFNILIEDLLMKDGIIRFHDAYSYAQKAIDTLSETYTDLFPLRFRYVFIDEYQDCDIIQRKALMKIFDSEKCSVMNIGDPDQAIYNSSNKVYLTNHAYDHMKERAGINKKVADRLGAKAYFLTNRIV